MKGEFNFRCKFSSRDVSKVSEWLKESNKFSPREFTRETRTLDEMSHWKAIEFRHILLYFGLVVLKGILQPEMYEHFIYLFCAIRIASCETLVSNDKMRLIAKKLLLDYVEMYIDIYGLDSINSNVHNLCHLMDDVERFGGLRNISAYPFESALYQIKRKLKTGAKPLAQIRNRIIELYSCQVEDRSNQTVYPILYGLRTEKTPSGESCYVQLRFKTFMLGANVKDRWLLTKNGSVVSMNYAIQNDNGKFIVGQPIKNLNDSFIKPFASHYLDIYTGELDFVDSKRYDIEDIKCKMVGLKNHDSLYTFIPLLHTF